MKAPAADFDTVFETLKGALAKLARKLAVKADTSEEYTLHTKRPSPFPQHKGEPLFFASIRKGKAYVSFHLLPLYMNPSLVKGVSPSLKKRMQGKACFNFKTNPEPELVAELGRLSTTGFEEWAAKKWA